MNELTPFGYWLKKHLKFSWKNPFSQLIKINPGPEVIWNLTIDWPRDDPFRPIAIWIEHRRNQTRLYGVWAWVHIGPIKFSIK